MKAFAAIIAFALTVGPAMSQDNAASASAPAAPASGGIIDKMMNNPLTPWNVYGPNQSSKMFDRDGPKNYPMTRVRVTAKGAHAWDVGAVMPVARPAAAGDVIYIAVYLRAPEAKDGEKVAMPFIGVTGAKPPYELVAGDQAAITNQWAQYYALGTATKAYAAGGLQATVHLAADKHVIDVGPIRVFDFGPNYDTSRLPRNR